MGPGGSARCGCRLPRAMSVNRALSLTAIDSRNQPYDRDRLFALQRWGWCIRANPSRCRRLTGLAFALRPVRPHSRRPTPALHELGRALVPQLRPPLESGSCTWPGAGTYGYADYSRVLAGDMMPAGAFHKAHWRALRGGLQVVAHAAPLMMTTKTRSARLHKV